MESDKKVLIITYYWPPIGGSGVQRWLKMSRHLRDKGWEPIIYTPENPSFGIKDESLTNEVSEDMEIIKMPIWEPYSLFTKLKGKSGNVNASDIRIKKNKNFFDKVMLWIRGNLFIPDPRRFWVKPSVKFLPDIIYSNNIKVVITTGPPHSLHLIGMKLKKKTGVKWVADFRDPWTQWDLYQEFPMLPFIRNIHKKLEQKVLTTADAVLTINKAYKDGLEHISGRNVGIVSNGFDESDFYDYKRRATDKFTIRYVGIIDEMRDPAPFTKGLKIFLKSTDAKEDSVKVEFIGNISRSFRIEVLEDPLLSRVVSFKPYKPHKEIIKNYETTDVLLLILTSSEQAASNVPGKIFEYMASGAPILAIGPTDGEVANLLNKTGSGKIAESHDEEHIAKILADFFKEYKMNEQQVVKDVEQYSRRYQSYLVAKVLDEL